MMCNVHDPSLGRGGVHIAPPPLHHPPPQFVSNIIGTLAGTRHQAPGSRQGLRSVTKLRSSATFIISHQHNQPAPALSPGHRSI